MGSTPWFRDRTLRRVLSAQLVLTVAASALAFPWSEGAAPAVLLGGATCVGATAYCGFRLFAVSGDSPRETLTSLHRAALGKMVVAGALLLAVMALLEEINFIALCLGYVVVQIGGNVLGAATGPGHPG